MKSKKKTNKSKNKTKKSKSIKNTANKHAKTNFDDFQKDIKQESYTYSIGPSVTSEWLKIDYDNRKEMEQIIESNEIKKPNKGCVGILFEKLINVFKNRKAPRF